MQSIDYTMNAAPSPSFADPNSGGSTPGAGAALSSLQDFLASQQFSGGMQSPTGDFADLLAEFTLPNNALSPETLGKSPEPSGASEMEGIAFGASFGSTGRQREKSAQEVLLEQLGFPVSQLAPNLGQDGASSSKEQVNLALASMDSGTRAQLLNALLTLKQQTTSGSPAASNPSPRAAALSPHPLNSPRYHEQPSQGSPLAYSSQPPSQHNSPQAFQSYNSPVPHPLQQQHIPPSQAPYQPLPAALAASLPPSAVSSPVGSPYIHATNPQPYYGPSPAPQVPGSPFGTLPTYQNAFSPRPFDAMQQQSQPPAVQAQLAMDLLARVNGQGVPDMAMRGGSATGGSYATNPEGEDWGETDFMFSPLMSPALTPQSVFTQASSLPASTSYLPSGSLVSPADFFSPLGSPAIMPQQFQDDPNQWQQQQQHRNSLQGLVDQTRALGFDSNLAALQGAASYGSPSSYFPQGQPGISPRLGPNDAGQGTGAGSGRRGAGSKKARPSPLLKPTPDGGSLRRKKAGPAAGSRSASISSASGVRSATTSPFLGPTASKANSASSVASGHAPSHSQSSGSASGSQKATPPEETSNGINTPSPVDLAMGEVTTSGGYQPELMGPPPPPSTDSRRQSLNGANASEWIGPVTPASFMNLPSDFNVNDLSALTPGLPHSSASSSQSYDVGSSTPLPPLPTLPDLAPASSAPPPSHPLLLAPSNRSWYPSRLPTPIFPSTEALPPFSRRRRARVAQERRAALQVARQRARLLPSRVPRSDLLPRSSLYSRMVPPPTR
ncbi:hypothetical protein BCR35DRAFT_8085 [Leucosporidium creatinivorum]|uniref:Uncharacterized protein n=1 Tax=Leucosporidium creatinivorum TaxID=106004 RepID=A0A1Y2G4B4_9BASI|nr:hypothetical protein BCR35DRAFT_8085 [Leucosporidium creatinivorum]